MKMKVISRSTDEFTRERSQDMQWVFPNFYPSLRSQERAVEYVRSLNAAKLDKIFARPFIGAMDGYRDSIKCMAKTPNINEIAAKVSKFSSPISLQIPSSLSFPGHQGVVQGLTLFGLAFGVHKLTWQSIHRTDLFPLVKFLEYLTGLRPKLESLHRKLDEVFEDVINEHKASKGTEGESDDLVDVILNLQENGDLEFPLTTDNIKAVVLDLFIAGSDASFTTLEWAMSEMLKNPRVMRKAQAEVRQVFR
ncbi:costunolide synthase-like [Hibiscus syriacus]|uniref:costunolide synthase-like n=1 Tax=Hibiscus syriacus TaxID=106335 RepID=UPI001925121E|nr:costunolide synthase-like [Hibiscus syriacus]